MLSRSEERWDGPLNSVTKASQDEAVARLLHSLRTNVPSLSLRILVVSTGVPLFLELEIGAPLVGLKGDLRAG